MVSRLRLQVFVAGVGFLAIALSLAYFLLAVSRQQEPGRGGTYVEGFVVEGSPELVLNPLMQVNDLSRDVSSLIFSGLTRNAVDGTVKEDLSDGWGPIDDGKTWEFHIRQNARWQDGTPVTARDVVFTVGLIKSPDFGTYSPAARALSDIWQDIEVDRLGDYNVRFRLTKGVWTPFLNYTSFGILPEHILGKQSLSEIRRAEFNNAPIGSGPFSLKTGGIARDGVTLTVNPLYYGDKPFIDKIWLRYYPSASAAMSALETRQVEGVSFVPVEDRTSLANNKDYIEISAPVAANTFLFLNLDRTDRFAEKEVRQAIAYAINRQSLIKEEFAGQATLSNSPILSYLWAFKQNIKIYDYNPSKARDILEKAGWKNNSEGVRSKEGQPLTFSILVGNADSASIAERIRADLGAVGIVVQVRISPSPQSLQSDLENRRFDALLLATKGVINDPDVYQIWSTGKPFNYSNWKNDKADLLIEKARTSLNQGERKQLYDQWQDIFADELPAIPLYYESYSYAVSSKVQGIEPGKLKIVNEFSDRFKDITSRYVITNTKFG